MQSVEYKITTKKILKWTSRYAKFGLLYATSLNKLFQKSSAVFSDFAAPMQDLSCSYRADPEFLVSGTGQILKIFSGSELCFFNLV